MEAHGACDCDTLVNPVDLPCVGNLRFTPHPISTDPRIEQGYEVQHEHDLKNVQVFAERILEPRADMVVTNEEDAAFTSVGINCCCGRADCVYLEHNNTALGGLERDLETAARLGQNAVCDRLVAVGTNMSNHTMSSPDAAPLRRMASSPTPHLIRWTNSLTASREGGGLTFALQALLLRHESYINESQAEQARLSTYVSELEAERLSLQSANEKMVAENRDLLLRLEYLNGNLAESDQEVKRLEDLLSDCESEVKRLNNLARRTEELDDRVREMEQERQSLNKQMEEGWEESRSTLARWRESDRKVRELEEDVRRIEWEAQVDREKHERIVAQLERERAYERELGGAEGRLKGAAAVQSLNQDTSTATSGSKNVVSHFVKDILQDNANLQIGIEELRQLLQSSNEEVQNLRQQIVLHQPVPENEYEVDHQRSVSLDQELQMEKMSPMQHQREVHVHHHYHAKPARSQVTSIRKPTRRRIRMPGYGSISDSSMPPTPSSKAQRHNLGPVAPLNLTQKQKNRWSMQSSATMSSVLSSIPSSPRSYFDRGGIFDRIERGEESSRPTSPESMADLLSPGPGQWTFQKDKGPLPECEEEEIQPPAFDMSPLVESKPVFDANDVPTPIDSELPEPDNEQASPLQSATSEADKELTPKPSLVLQPSTNEANDSMTEITEPRPPSKPPSPSRSLTASRDPSRTFLHDLHDLRPPITRKGSHETLVSISGMDIHLTQRAPPVATLELLHSHFAHRPAQTRKISAGQPVTEVTEYTATSMPTFSRPSHSRTTSQQIPSSIEVLSGIAVPKVKVTRTAPQAGAMGRLGGWVRGRLGVTQARSSDNVRSTPSSRAASVHSTRSAEAPNVRPEIADNSTNSSTSSTAASVIEPEITNTGTTSRSISVPSRPQPNPLHAKVDPMILFMGRSPGVNQPGSIPGFRATVMSRRTPSQVMTSVIDEEGLKESLAE